MRASGVAVTLVVHEHKRLGRGLELAALAEQLRAFGVGLEGQLLDGCITMGCAVSAGFATKWVLEAPNNPLTDWMVLVVVLVLNVGIGMLAYYAMKRRRQ